MRPVIFWVMLTVLSLQVSACVFPVEQGQSHERSDNRQEDRREDNDRGHEQRGGDDDRDHEQHHDGRN